MIFIVETFIHIHDSFKQEAHGPHRSLELNLGQYRNIFSNIEYAFHFHLPHPTLGGNYFNQLAFVPC
jgi:hypothetical protein